VKHGEPWIARSRAELLDGVQSRATVDPGDARSGSAFERVTINGEPFFVKTVGYRTDWIMRVTGDRDLRTLKIWASGLMHDTPPEIDHAVVGMVVEGEGHDALLTMLMRDVGEHLFAEGDTTISRGAHLGLIDSMAALAVQYLDWSDDLALTTMQQRLRFFAPDNIAAEAAAPAPPLPIQVAVQGWSRLAERAPDLYEVVTAIHADPDPLVDALRTTPQTFVHGDWKMGNLGRHPDGRTFLLDWAMPGAGPITWDLTWYLALNAARLPMPKEETIEALRAALERRGVPTDGWFDHQLDLCVLGMAACVGWEKAVGADDELRWWEHRALRAARLLPRVTRP
jgi:hypothetical protein